MTRSEKTTQLKIIELGINIRSEIVSIINLEKLSLAINYLDLNNWSHFLLTYKQ